VNDAIASTSGTLFSRGIFLKCRKNDFRMTEVKGSVSLSESTCEVDVLDEIATIGIATNAKHAAA
jgi:hypothetical protein